MAKSRRRAGDRNLLSLAPISVRGRFDLPISTRRVDRDRASICLVRDIGIRETLVPIGKPTQEHPVVFSKPGSSVVKRVCRTRGFAYAFLRQTLAVALETREFEQFRKGTRLSRVRQIPYSGLSWYMISGKRLNLSLARWSVSHWQRTFGLDPRPPREIVQLPTYDFLANYSLKNLSYSDGDRNDPNPYRWF